MTSKVKLRLFAFFSIIFLCVGLTIKSLQNDTFYIIKLGGDIVKNGIDFIDHYSWIGNLSYTYPHWLYDVFLYIIYNNFSYVGIYVSTMILFIILILSVYIINLKINKNELMAIIVALVTIPCLAGFATARAQLITAILFLWQVYLIEKLIATGKKKYVVFLSLISLLVANLHATIWPFYFILYLPFIGHHLVLKLLGLNKKMNLDKLLFDEINNFKLLMISMFLGFLMGFLSPSKICFTYVFKVMLGNSQDFIIEHAPMVLIDNFSFLIFILVILFVLIFTKTKIKITELLMICGLVFMSLCSFRHVAFFCLIGLLYFSILCNRYLIENNDRTLDILSNLFIKNKCIYFFVFVLVIILFGYNLNKNVFDDYIPEEEYPVDAVKFMKSNLDIDNVYLYNDYNFGSYLLFNDIPVFIDSRCDLYLSEFNGLEYSIFDDAMNMEYNYEEKFDIYDVSHILIYRDTIFYKILSKDDDYVILYEDEYFSLFERLSYNEN